MPSIFMAKRRDHKWCSTSAITQGQGETQCKEPVPSGSVWSGRPFLVECVSIGRATESAEQRANLNFFFASLKEEKYFLNTVDERSAFSIRNLYFPFYLILPRIYLTSF